jgi:O-antigen/teichoic acid export membrane protein
VSATVKSLTSGRILARSAIWNLVGMAAPMLVALIAIPLLIDGMGKERFGLLAIIWMGVGYFSLFDLGLGRALTKMVSERLGRDELSGLGSLIWTALSLLTLLGVFGALLLIVFSPALVTGLLQCSRCIARGGDCGVSHTGRWGARSHIQQRASWACWRRISGLVSSPLIQDPARRTHLRRPAHRAAIHAKHCLGNGSAAGQSPGGISRLLLGGNSCAYRELRTPRSLERSHVRHLLSFGGWLTVTNIVGPLMTYMDRFFISAMLGLAAVAYYVTPYEVLSRLQMLPQAIMGVLFPAMAAAHGGDQQRLVHLYANSSRVTYWAMLPVTAGAFLLAPEALLIWLGEDFRDAATLVVHWLAVGWMINTLARPAFTALQSVGRPDLVAKAHLSELVPYLGLLLLLAKTHGIAGVAAAWTLRVVADTLILNALVAFQMPALRAQVRRACLTLLITGSVFAAFWMMGSLVLRSLALMLVVCIAALMLWPIARQAMQGGIKAKRQEV